MALHLQGTVSLDGSGFESGLNKIEHGAHRVGETLKGLALSAIGIYGIEQAISKTVETADKLVDTSRRLGIGLEALQEFGYAAKQNGSDIEKLTTFIEKLNSTRIDPKKFESFAKLGISQPDLSSLKVEDLIMKLSLNLRNRSSQEVIGPLRDIGGRGAGEMIVMLKDNLEELRNEAQNLGLVIDTKTLVTLKYLRDEMMILSEVIITQLAPAISGLLKMMLYGSNLIRSAITFYSEIAKNINWRDPLNIFTKGKSLSDVIPDAALSAGTQLALLNLATDKRLAGLEMQQKQFEEINRNPDFDSIAKEGKEKIKHAHATQIATDSLLRTGNFLGSSANPMVQIGQAQLQALHQIARNTQWRSAPGHNPYPHH